MLTPAVHHRAATVSGGLMAYWIYQHIGNLSYEDIRDHDLLDRARAEEDTGEFLREQMRGADREAGHSRWSFCRDLGGSGEE